MTGIPMSDQMARTIESYDHAPSEYAARFQASDVSPLREEFIASLEPGCGLILDAGCGVGRDVAAFAATGFEVVGVDLSVGLLEEAGRVLAEAGQIGGLMQCNFRDLPFGDESVAAVWSMASLVHLDRGEAVDALSEFHRVLAAGGVAFVSTKAGEGSEWVPGPGGGLRWFHYYSEDDVCEMATEAGLSVVSLDSGEGCSHGTWVNAVLKKGKGLPAKSRLRPLAGPSNARKAAMGKTPREPVLAMFTVLGAITAVVAWSWFGYVMAFGEGPTSHGGRAATGSILLVLNVFFVLAFRKMWRDDLEHLTYSQRYERDMFKEWRKNRPLWKRILLPFGCRPPRHSTFSWLD